MTPAEKILRLAEIESERARLSDEAQRLIAALAGAGEGAQVTVTPFVDNIHERPEPDATTPAIDRENLVTVAQAAFEWKCSTKTMRKRADVYGAIRHVGGAIYVDRLAFIRGVNFQNLPNFSNAKKSKKPDHASNRNGNHK